MAFSRATPVRCASTMAESWYASLKTSLQKNAKSRDSRYFQVATVDGSGRPANRTVVYRGFLPTADGRVDSRVVTFVTDARSEKVGHLRDVPYAEVAWYFPVTREQYRISGKVRVVTADFARASDDIDRITLSKARDMAWKNMSDPGRQQFLWPHPGRVRSGDDEGQYTAERLPGKDDPVAPAFCLCCLEADRVSILSLKSNERTDFRYMEDGEWQATRVNP